MFCRECRPHPSLHPRQLHTYMLMILTNLIQINTRAIRKLDINKPQKIAAEHVNVMYVGGCRSLKILLDIPCPTANESYR